MTVPYNLTEPNWHPLSFLAYYSDAPTNFQNSSTVSDTKPVVGLGTGSGFYERSLSSRRYALAGVACSIIIGSFCTIAGIVIILCISTEVAPIMPVDHGGSSSYILGLAPAEMLTMVITLIITLCTESMGFVHSISLRSALASESRLRFNANLRLLTAAGRWWHPNGFLLNGIMAILLVLSYVSAPLIITYVPDDHDNSSDVGIAGLPLLLLGVVLLLQAVITLSGVRTVKVLTWSCSPFDLVAALVHHTQLTPVSLRCMRCVSDRDVLCGPVRPSETQPSAWHAHPSIRKVVMSLWGLVIACAAWAALVQYLSVRYPVSSGGPGTVSIDSVWKIPGTLQISSGWIIPCFTALIQGPLTLALHCAELIVNTIQDERRWRCATTREGLKTEMGPLKSFFTNPLGLVLFAAKAVIHWMFGLSMCLVNENLGSIVTTYWVTMDTLQILYLCIALFVLVCFLTFMTLRRPRGPQPAAYGHLQTLANLVDEWSLVMWWGHKEEGIPYCHAGTSDHSLQAVKMDCVYAGYPINSHRTSSGNMSTVRI